MSIPDHVWSICRKPQIIANFINQSASTASSGMISSCCCPCKCRCSWHLGHGFLAETAGHPASARRPLLPLVSWAFKVFKPRRFQRWTYWERHGTTGLGMSWNPKSLPQVVNQKSSIGTSQYFDFGHLWTIGWSTGRYIKARSELIQSSG